MDPDAKFEELVERMLREEGVTPPTGGAGFGGNALKVNNRIFAMLVRDQLVVKLPKEQIDALVSEGQGTRFDANKGQPMKEWLTLSTDSTLSWDELALAALVFVRASH